MRVRDAIDRIKYGGLREFRAVALELRDEVLSGTGRYIVIALALILILVALLPLFKTPEGHAVINEPAQAAARSDREILMQMSEDELDAEEKRRAAIAEIGRASCRERV